MKRPDPIREDDGRVIADMAPLSGRDDAPRPEIPPMTKAETRRLIASATLAGLLVVAVLSLAVVALVLFCQFVWFR